MTFHRADTVPRNQWRIQFADPILPDFISIFARVKPFPIVLCSPRLSRLGASFHGIRLLLYACFPPLCDSFVARNRAFRVRKARRNNFHSIPSRPSSFQPIAPSSSSSSSSALLSAARSPPGSAFCFCRGQPCFLLGIHRR